MKKLIEMVLSSKKMTAKLIGILAVVMCYASAFLASKLGIDVPTEKLLEYATTAAMLIVGLVATHITGQSIADIGKEKAKAEAEGVMRALGMKADQADRERAAQAQPSQPVSQPATSPPSVLTTRGRPAPPDVA